MEVWVGLVSWPTSDTLPTKWSHVNRRSGIGQGKSARPKTDVLTTEPCRQCNMSHVNACCCFLCQESESVAEDSGTEAGSVVEGQFRVVYATVALLGWFQSLVSQHTPPETCHSAQSPDMCPQTSVLHPKTFRPPLQQMHPSRHMSPMIFSPTASFFFCFPLPYGKLWFSIPT